MTQVTKIPMDRIFCDETFNCRGRINVHDIIPLARGLQKDGLIEPIIVQPFKDMNKPLFSYRIIAGHRRFMAAKYNNWTDIDCIIREGLTEFQARGLNIKENIQRQDLNILQEARGIEPYKRAGWKLDALAKELEVSTFWVKIRYILIDMEPEIQNMAAAGLLTQENIRDLDKIPGTELRFLAIRKLKDARAREDSKIQVHRILKSRPKPLARRIRNTGEILEMSGDFYETIGPCLTTRFGAWASGQISDIELLKDLKLYCEENDLRFSMPERFSNHQI